jgi:hypothetical protein
LSPRTLTMVRRPPSLRGVPPRYQVFDRRKNPPMTVSRFWFDPAPGMVVFEVYDDEFRELLKRDPAFADRRFDWMLDVEPDAPHDPRAAIVRPEPMPAPERRGEESAPVLTLEETVEALRGRSDYRVIRTSDPR